MESLADRDEVGSLKAKTYLVAQPVVSIRDPTFEEIDDESIKECINDIFSYISRSIEKDDEHLLDGYSILEDRVVFSLFGWRHVTHEIFSDIRKINPKLIREVSYVHGKHQRYPEHIERKNDDFLCITLSHRAFAEDQLPSERHTGRTNMENIEKELRKCESDKETFPFIKSVMERASRAFTGKLIFDVDTSEKHRLYTVNVRGITRRVSWKQMDHIHRVNDSFSTIEGMELVRHILYRLPGVSDEDDSNPEPVLQITVFKKGALKIEVTPRVPVTDKLRRSPSYRGTGQQVIEASERGRFTPDIYKNISTTRSRSRRNGLPTTTVKRLQPLGRTIPRRRGLGLK